MPRLLSGNECPHCGAARKDLDSGSCDACGGSLQQRHLRAGCISAAPLWLALTCLAGGWLFG